MKGVPRRGFTLSLAGAGVAAAAFLLLATPAWAAPPAGTQKNSCVDCHADPNFLVTNKELYDYYRAWQASAHGRANVTCVDCHGGNPNASDKATAHGGQPLSASNPVSPVNYENVPQTCANCHKDVAASYRQSEHFKHLRENPDEKQGPSCVTCHGSVNTSVLNVGTVRQACERCHNDQTGIYPEIPQQAEEILGTFLTIDRFHRYLATHQTPQQASVNRDLDARVKLLDAHWHTFDLDKVGSEAKELLNLLNEQREKIAKEQQTGSAPR